MTERRGAWWLDMRGQEVQARVTELVYERLAAQGGHGATDTEVFTRSLFAGISKNARTVALAQLEQTGRICKVRVPGLGRARFAWVAQP